MCLIVLAYKVHPRYPLIVAANRDEFLARPTSPMHFWDDAPTILAGRDDRAGGTWMGLSTAGRFAALTNFRDLRQPQREGLSRGLLVRQALEQDIGSLDTSAYAACNLLFGTVDDLCYHSNVDGTNSELLPGIHGLSNHLLNTPWPKVQRAKADLAKVIEGEEVQVEALFSLLSNPALAADEELPETGLSLDWERELSAVMIRTEGYATRCSTVLLVGAKGGDNQRPTRIVERSHMPHGAQDQVFDLLL